jgi:hypothetical protein
VVNRDNYVVLAYFRKANVESRLAALGVLAGEYVHVVPAAGRWMIFYCAALVRELDPQIPDSSPVF